MGERILGHRAERLSYHTKHHLLVGEGEDSIEIGILVKCKRRFKEPVREERGKCLFAVFLLRACGVLALLLQKEEDHYGDELIGHGAKFPGVYLRHEKQPNIGKPQGAREGVTVLPQQYEAPPKEERVCKYARQAHARHDLRDHHVIPVHGKHLGVIDIGIARVAKPNAENGVIDKILYRAQKQAHARLISLDKAARKAEGVKFDQKSACGKGGNGKRRQNKKVAAAVLFIAPQQIEKAKRKEREAHEHAAARAREEQGSKEQ